MKKIFFLISLLNYSLISIAQNYFNYDLTFQKLEIWVNPNMRFITGKVDYYFKDADSLVGIDLSTALAVDSIIYHGLTADFTHENDMITVNFHSKPSVIDSITIYYHGEPPQTGMGSFIVSTHGDNVPVMWTLSEPYGARDWFPTKNNLGDKIDSLIFVIHTDSIYRSASNGVLLQDTVINGQRTMVWKTNYPIASYLVAFAVTNYAVYYDYANIGDTLLVPIMNMVYPEDLETARSKTPHAARCLEFYSQKFIPYPFYKEKYGHAEFGWGGGMEHQTMTFVGGFGQSLLAHELAHQWFGDYITCGSWHDIYLNEAFATYLEGLTAEAGIADYTFSDWLSSARNRVLSIDTGSVYVQDTTNVNRIFNYTLTYLKGALFLHLIRWTIGDSAFFQGLRNYLLDSSIAYAYGYTHNLKYHLEQACNCDLTNIFDDWLYGQGYPLYDIYWEQKNNELKIDIEQKPQSPNVDVFELKLPILVQTANYDTLLILDNTQLRQNFSFNIKDKIENIVFDPQKWIPAKANIIDNNPLIVPYVYPNPAQNNLNIVLLDPDSLRQISIFNMQGRLIKNINGPYTSEISLDITSLYRGVYFITLDYYFYRVQLKFIKL